MAILIVARGVDVPTSSSVAKFRLSELLEGQREVGQAVGIVVVLLRGSLVAVRIAFAQFEVRQRKSEQQDGKHRPDKPQPLPAVQSVKSTTHRRPHFAT